MMGSQTQDPGEPACTLSWHLMSKAARVPSVGSRDAVKSRRRKQAHKKAYWALNGAPLVLHCYPGILQIQQLGTVALPWGTKRL